MKTHKPPISKDELIFVWDMIDRDFASIEQQDRADKILDALAKQFFDKPLLELRKL